MTFQQLTYLLKVDGVVGDSTIEGYQGAFTVDEFTFNELTKLANGTGGGGGVAGKAQFDPLMVDIAGLSSGLVTLLKDAATGKHIPTVELVGLKPSGDGFQKVSDLTLNNVTIAGYSADGGHDTALAFDYTKVTETIKGQNPDGSLNAGQTFAFNLATNGGSITPVNHDALTAFAHSHDGAQLTYLLKVDGVVGDSTIEGYQGAFTVDEFTFNELTKLANGTGGGGGVAGKAQFDPLMVDIAGLSSGLVTLLKDAATGKHIPTVELVGLKPSGDGFQKVSDLTLNNVTIAGYAADGGHDTALAFDYTKVTETIKGQNPDGSLNAGQTFAFNLATNGGSITPVNHDALTAFAHSHDGAQLTYLLKVDGVVGDSTIEGYQGAFTVDEFTFNELTKLANGTGGGGGVAGKAQFDPLMVDIAGLSSGLVTLLKDAATGKHIPTVELVGLKPSGDGFQKVSDLTLNNVTIAGYSADGGHDTALAFDYTKVTETIKGQNPDGSLNAGQTFAFNLATNGITPVNHDALTAFAHSHDGAQLTYLLKVDGVVGDLNDRGLPGRLHG